MLWYLGRLDVIRWSDLGSTLQEVHVGEALNDVKEEALQLSREGDSRQKLTAKTLRQECAWNM